jgi:hypothetical protein
MARPSRTQDREQQLQTLLTRAQSNSRVAEALAHFNRAAAITPAPVYTAPASRFTAGANG